MSQPQTQEPIAPHKLIEQLCKATEVSFSSKREVKQAFTMGLFIQQIPRYMLEHLQPAYDWDLYEISPDIKGQWGVFESLYPLILKFNFIADTGTSWHPIYQELRQRGWKRSKVYREGGKLQYLMEMTRDGMPQGYSTLHLLLNITISTCKQVQVGTETKEVPIMKTVCEDLVEVEGEEEATKSENHANIYALPVELPEGPPPAPEPCELIGVSGIEGEGQFNLAEFLRDDNEITEGGLDPRCDHGNLSGCCPNSSCAFYMGDEEPAASDSYDPAFKDDIPF